MTSNAMLNVVLNNFGLQGSGTVANSAQLWSHSYGSSMLSIGGVTLPLNLLVAVNGAYSLVGLWWAHAACNNHSSCGLWCKRRMLILQSGNGAFSTTANMNIGATVTAGMVYSPSQGFTWVENHNVQPNIGTPTVSDST